MRYAHVDTGDGHGPRRWRLLGLFPLREGRSEVRVAWVLAPWGGVFGELESADGEESLIMRQRVHDDDPRGLAVRVILSALEELRGQFGADEVERRLDSGDIWIDWDYLSLSPEMDDLLETSDV